MVQANYHCSQSALYQVSTNVLVSLSSNLAAFTAYKAKYITAFVQDGEDMVLRSPFLESNRGMKGFYVDVGAFHAFRASNTYALYRLGWRGINIEPNPDGFKSLLRHRKRDTNLQLAISREDGIAPFTVDGLYSGISDPTHLFTGRSVTARNIKVSTRPLRAVLDKYVPANVSIDFMSVDCEGHDIVVLQSNDWDRYRPKLILCEDHEQRPDSVLDRHMRTIGYEFYARLYLTKIYLERQEAIQQLPASRILG